MQLIATKPQHIEQLMTWFTNQDDLHQWVGTEFRFPYDYSSFCEDLALSSTPSYSLMDATGELMAFGQYYARLERCHLARLVVNPKHRGKGHVGQLIKQLSEKGKHTLGLECTSLFVLPDNPSAQKAYQKLGFEIQSYPEMLAEKNCIYMVK